MSRDIVWEGFVKWYEEDRERKTPRENTGRISIFNTSESLVQDSS